VNTHDFFHFFYCSGLSLTFGTITNTIDIQVIYTQIASSPCCLSHEHHHPCQKRHRLFPFSLRSCCHKQEHHPCQNRHRCLFPLSLCCRRRRHRQEHHPCQNRHRRLFPCRFVVVVVVTSKNTILIYSLSESCSTSSCRSCPTAVTKMMTMQCQHLPPPRPPST
jgi:hypothetical protein